MRTISNIFGIGAITLVSACGGASGGSTVFDVQKGPAPPTYDPNSGVLSVNGTQIADRNDRTFSRRGNGSVTNEAGSGIYQARVENGNAFAVTYNDINGDSGTIYGRRNAADFSGRGTARFIGDYVGLSIRNPDGIGGGDPGFSAAVLGNAILDADLNNETISGRITARTTRTVNGVPFSNPVNANDVEFTATRLRGDGSFSTTTTGGEFTQAGATFLSSGGQIEGFIGENFGGFGSSASGTFTMDHTKVGENVFRETGVFVASEDTSPF